MPTNWLDFGKDHYATVSWSDAPGGRRTAIGWMSNWQYAAEVPTMQFRSANTLPREIGLFTAPDGQIYASSTPSPELASLRGKTIRKGTRATIGTKGNEYALPPSGVCEIQLNVDAQKASSLTFTLKNTAGEQTVMTYDPVAHTFSFDRTRSGITDFSQEFPAVTSAPTFEDNGKLALSIFIDRSSIEVFGNDGRFAMTNLVFPTAPHTTLSVSAAGGKAKITDLTIYSIAE